MSLSTRTFALTLLFLMLLAISLRAVFPTADPPWRTQVGVVWHDEGAWTHNARNRVLFGQWRLDAWNPIFLAPVFTGLEYASFATFGVGTWQARVVSQTAGSLAVLLLALGVTRVGGRRAGLIAAALLATNYVAVMYDRAAIMESSMAAFVVFAWYGFARAQRQPAWGLFAATAALLAYFTKAAAAFSLAALALTALWSLLESRDPIDATSTPAPPPASLAPSAVRLRGESDAPLLGEVYAFLRRATHTLLRRETYALRARNEADLPRAAAVWTLLGLVAGTAIALTVFVLPWWPEYRFYNWQMSVTRKPSYDLKSLIDRISWFPILHDVFTRMWPVYVTGLIAWTIRLFGWRRITPAERLLVLWVGIGIAEMILHDVGNERRFVFLIPAFVALAALALGSAASANAPLVPADAATIWTRRRALIAAPLVLYLAYIAIGPIARLVSIYEPGPGARLTALLAVIATALLYTAWPQVLRWASTAPDATPADTAAHTTAAHTTAAPANAATTAAPTRTGTPAAFAPATWTALAFTAIVVAGNLTQFAQWAAGRTYVNIEASRALGRVLPPGTLVHGKLANGLDLENRIKPIFIGRGFGNYDDRLNRDDVPYLLTYVAPREGYEGPVILDVLQAYPQRRIIWTADVAETPGGHDRAALFVKGPPAPVRSPEPTP